MLAASRFSLMFRCHMLTFVIRCYRTPVGKIVRHAMRRHWGVSHHAANVLYHGTWLTCVAVPFAVAGVRFVPALVPKLAPPAGFMPSHDAFALPPNAIPEPSTLAVFAVGVLILLWIIRMRRL